MVTRLLAVSFVKQGSSSILRKGNLLEKEDHREWNECCRHSFHTSVCSLSQGFVLQDGDGMASTQAWRGTGTRAACGGGCLRVMPVQLFFLGSSIHFFHERSASISKDELLGALVFIGIPLCFYSIHCWKHSVAVVA